MTRLSQFDFRSRLRTWAYRVAVNHILDVKKSAIERLHLSSSISRDADHGTRFGRQIRRRAIDAHRRGEGRLQLAMLQCLDRPHRLAYVLGEIMELPGPEAAEALDISRELFRKRLQHARAAVLSFTKTYCGLASDSAPCRCSRQAAGAVRDGRIDVHQLTFAGTRSSFESTSDGAAGRRSPLGARSPSNEPSEGFICGLRTAAGRNVRR